MVHQAQDAPALNPSHLDIDFDCPQPVDEMSFSDIYIGLDIDLLASTDGVITDSNPAPTDRNKADDPQGPVSGQISPFTLSGWLRHGCEAVLQIANTTACHPGEANTDYKRANTYERDLEIGYHEKGSCTADYERGCVIYDLFGGSRARPGKLIRRPISFAPTRQQVDVLAGEAEAHYRQVTTHVRSRNGTDDGQPLRQATRDVLSNVEGAWKLTLRDLKPEFIGLLTEAAHLLDTHSDEFALQLGGARNFGAGIADVCLINPLYTDQEIRRVFSPTQQATQAMNEKDQRWADTYRPQFRQALQARLTQRDTDAALPGDIKRGALGDSGGAQS